MMNNWLVSSAETSVGHDKLLGDFDRDLGPSLYIEQLVSR